MIPSLIGPYQSVLNTVKLSGTQNFVQLAHMLQLDISQVKELDLCLPSNQAGSKDNDMPAFIANLTGLRTFTDRSGYTMAASIKVSHQLDKLSFPRNFSS